MAVGLDIVEKVATKVCRKCGITKPLGAFHSKKAGRRESHCRDCRKVDRRRRYGSPEYQETMRRYHESAKGRETMRLYKRNAYRRDPVKSAYERAISQAKFYKYCPPNISLDDYRKLVVTTSECAICGKGQGTRLCLDHCHFTGFVRGMLCRRCNTTLGLLDDSVSRLNAAIRYLENAEAKQKR